MNLLLTTEYQFLSRVFCVWLKKLNHSRFSALEKKQNHYCFIVATHLLEFCRKNNYMNLQVDILISSWLTQPVKSIQPSNELLVDDETVFLVIKFLTTCSIATLWFHSDSNIKTQAKNFLVFLVELKAFFQKQKIDSNTKTHSNFQTLCKNKQLLKIYYTYRLTFKTPLSNNDPKKYYMGYRGSVVPPILDNYYSSSRTVQNYVNTYGKESFRKKILGIYLSAERALRFEVHYHEVLNVANHANFFNLARQTTTGFYFNNTGRVQSVESNKARSEKQSGRKKFHSAEGLQRIAKYQKIDRQRSDEELTDLRSNTLARNKQQTTCPHCGKNGQLVAMKRWHFDHCPKKLDSHSQP